MIDHILKTNNMFPDFKKPYAQHANANMQYDATTGGIINCMFPQVGPMEVAITKNYPRGTNVSLSAYQAVAEGNCTRTSLEFQGRNDLNNFIDMEYEVYQQLYATIPSGTATSSLLVPIIGNTTVSCSDPTLIPYVLEYTMITDYSRFARFCMSASNASKISLTKIKDYRVFDYIEASTGKPCATNVCNTTLAPFLGFNLNDKPVVKVTKNEDSQKTTTYILLSVISVLGLILLGIFISYGMKINKARLKRKIKTTKDTTYNPVFSKS